MGILMKVSDSVPHLVAKLDHQIDWEVYWEGRGRPNPSMDVTVQQAMGVTEEEGGLLHTLLSFLTARN